MFSARNRDGYTPLQNVADTPDDFERSNSNSNTSISGTEVFHHLSVQNNYLRLSGHSLSSLPIAEKRAVEAAAKERAHLIGLAEVETMLETSLALGLSSEEVSRRQAVFGPNEFVGFKETPLFIKFLTYLFSGFGPILWIAALLCALAWRPLGSLNAMTPDPSNLGLSLVILFVIILQATFSFVQDMRSSKVLATFQRYLASEVSVRRNGSVTRVCVRDLTMGDVVLVSAGDKVAADLRIMEARNMKVDNSCLTGESEPLSCTPENTSPNLLESRNVLFCGTLAVEGTAVGCVFAVGPCTEMGRIASLASETPSIETSMHREIRRFVWMIVGLSLVTGITVLIVWVVLDNTFGPYRNFLSLPAITTNCISVIVAYVPEGLPVCVTLTLSLIARRMSSRYFVLVKQLGTVETLGAVSVIASDKTGTLTQNVMRVSHLSCGIDSYEARNPPLESISSHTQSFSDLLRASVLCNGAVGTDSDNDNSSSGTNFFGSAVDVAILHYTQVALGVSVANMRSTSPAIAVIPFNSRAKYMVSIHAANNLSKSAVVFIKGAPEIVIQRCSAYVQKDARESPLTATIVSQITQLNDAYCSTGERVIAVARLVLDPDLYPTTFSFNVDTPNFPLEGFCFLGLVGVSDPPRPGVDAAVRLCRSANVRVFMVTGDQWRTAVSIAEQVGILTPTGTGPPTLDRLDIPSPVGPEVFLTINSNNSRTPPRAIENPSALVIGHEIASMTEADWDWILGHDEVVFARTTPEHKLVIVRALRARGNVVAVTGDGVNDAPALKSADVGVAMGSGAEVSKEAASMTLLRDDFPSIVMGIEQGRLVFENLQKIILYLLPAGSWSEMLPVLANVIFGMPLPLSPFLMIIICVLTDVFASLALVYQRPETGLMNRPPRNLSRDHLVTWRLLLFAYSFVGMLESFTAFFVFFLFMHDNGVEPGDLVLAYNRWQDGYLGKTVDELNGLVDVGQSVFFVTLVVCQFGNLFNCATRRVPFLSRDNLQWDKFNFRIFPAILASACVAVLVTELSVSNSLFGTRPVPVQYWGVAAACSLSIFILCEARKHFVRRFPKSIVAFLAW